VFYEQTARRLWAYLYRSTGSGEQADDLLQEAYYRFLRCGPSASSEAHRRNYLYRIATNLVRDAARRRHGVQVALPDEDTAHTLTVEGAADCVPARADLARAMTRLSRREQDLLWLAYAEGSTHREIADMLGLTAGSVKQLLFRARRRLADLLGRRTRTTGPAHEERR
jgi:RNA polymerase sigma-70 factor, ECF subfamily